MANLPNEYKSAALRFWESGRIAFNLAIGGASAVGYFCATLPSGMVGDEPHLADRAVLRLFLISAIPANLLYSLGYALEFLVVGGPRQHVWLRHGRVVAFWSGTIAAAAVAFVVGMGIGAAVYTPARTS